MVEADSEEEAFDAAQENQHVPEADGLWDDDGEVVRNNTEIIDVRAVTNDHKVEPVQMMDEVAVCRLCGKPAHWPGAEGRPAEWVHTEEVTP